MSDAPTPGRELRHGLLYTLPTVVGMVLPLITLPIFSRVLTVDDYGTIALATAYGMFASGLANLGLPVIYERNFFQYTEQGAAARLLYSIVAFVLALLALLGAGTWVFRAELAHWLTGHRDRGAIFVVSYASFAVQSIKLYFLTYFKNDNDARAFVRYSIDETLLWTAMSLGFVVVLRAGPIGMPLGQLVGGSLIVVLLAVRFVRRLPPAFDRPLLEEAIRLSLPLTPRQFISVVSNNFDKYIVGALGTMGGVGVYSIGQKLAMVVFGVMTAFQNVFSPAVYRRMFAGGEQAEGIGPYLTPFAYASVGVALLAALFSEEALYLLTPPEYHGAAIIVNVLAVYYGILFFGKLPQLTFAKRTGLVSVLSAATVGIYVAFTWAFVMRWGAIGAAWGTLAAGIVSTAAGVWLGQRYFPIRFEVGKLAATYALLAIGAIGLFALERAEVGYAGRVAWKAVAVAAFFGLGRRLGYFDRRHVLALRSWLAARLGRPVPREVTR